MMANWETALLVYGMLAALFIPLLLIGRWMNQSTNTASSANCCGSKRASPSNGCCATNSIGCGRRLRRTSGNC